MSASIRTAFANLVARTAGYSRAELKKTITELGLPIKLNISTVEMRDQLIKRYANAMAQSTAEYIETAVGKATAKAKVEKVISEKRAARKEKRAFRKISKDAKKEREAAVAEKAAVNKARKEAAAARRRERETRYFATFRVKYEIEVKVMETETRGRGKNRRTVKVPKINPITGMQEIKQETGWGYFSVITRIKNPPAAEIEELAQRDMNQNDAAKQYKRKIVEVFKQSFLSVKLTEKQVDRFDALTGLHGRKEEYDDFLALVRELKLTGEVYREIYQINGFPDRLPQNGKCAVELLKSCGFDERKIGEWFNARYPVASTRVNPLKYTLEEYRALKNQPAAVNTRAWCAQDIFDFAVEHKRSCYLLDRRNYCFHKHIGSSHKTAVYAMIEGEHVYPVDDVEARRSIESKMREVKSEALASRGVAKKDKKNAHEPHICEFADVFAGDSLVPGVFYQTGGSLESVVSQFLKRKIIPDVMYDVDTDSINCVKFGKTKVLIKPEYESLKHTPFKSYAEIAYHYYDEMLKEHPGAKGTIIGSTAKAKLWLNEPIGDETHIGIDFSKFYYYCTMKLRRDIPVYGTGSMVSTSEYVDDGSHYYVITDDTRLFRGSDYYTCELINIAISNGIPFEIDHKLIGCTVIKPGIIREQLEKIVKCIGSLDAAKKAIVQFIGLLAKSQNKITSSYLIPSSGNDGANIAYYYLDELSRGKEVRFQGDRYPGMHMIAAKKMWPMLSNCGSIYREIISQSHIEVFLMAKKIGELAPGAELVGVKTDCLIYRRNEIVNSLGKINGRGITHRIPIKLEPVKSMGVIKMDLPEIKRFSANKKLIVKSESEFDNMDSLTENLIDEIYCGGVIRVEGFAGTGKSTAIRAIDKEFANHYRLQVLKFAPDNVSAANIDGKTIHSGFKLGCTSEGWENRIRVKGLENRIVIVDEISKADYRCVALLEYLSKFAYAVVLMGDCTYQCPPVLYSNISVSDAVNSFADVLFVLEVCKRGKDIMEPALKLFHEGDSSAYNRIKYKNTGDLADHYIAGGFERLICGSNAERLAFNTVMVEKLSDGKESIDIRLRTNTTVKKCEDIDTKLFVGMRLTVIKNDRMLQLIKTDMLRVESLNPLVVAVEHRCNGVENNNALRTITLDIKMLYGLVDIGYAITSFKAQSGTYTFKYIVLNIDDMANYNGLVSATRATQLNNVYVAECL